jgi:hypothetical protein
LKSEIQKSKIESRKPKTCKLAIDALIIPVVLWGSGFWVSEMVARFYSDTETVEILEIVLGLPAICAILASAPTGILLGIISLIQIKRSDGMLKGRRLAIEGIIVSVALECVFLWFTFTFGGR